MVRNNETKFQKNCSSAGPAVWCPVVRVVRLGMLDCYPQGAIYLLMVSHLLLVSSAAVDAELARQKIQLRGPEELQQATRFLHDNGNSVNTRNTWLLSPEEGYSL